MSIMETIDKNKYEVCDGATLTQSVRDMAKQFGEKMAIEHLKKLIPSLSEEKATKIISGRLILSGFLDGMSIMADREYQENE